MWYPLYGLEHIKEPLLLISSACYRPQSDCWYSLVPACAGGPSSFPPFFFLFRTEEQAKADTCARDRRALQQLALNVHVKLSDLIGKSSPYNAVCGFPLSLSEWSFIIRPTSYNRKQNVLSVSLNKHFLPSLVYHSFNFITKNSRTP